MDATLAIHIAAGSVSVVAGAAALLLRKGEAPHRAAGVVFVIAMIAMATSAAIVGAKDFSNSVAGALTIYAVLTGWMSARRRDGAFGSFEIIAGLVAAACAGGGYFSAWLISTGAKQPDNPYIVVATLILSSILVLAAIGDLSVALRRRISTRQRIARHLWRMCFALVIAVGSFAAQGSKALPGWFPAGESILVSIGLIAATMLFFLARVLFTSWLARPARPSSIGKEKSMSGGLFPKQFDNDYRGRRIALLLLAPIVFVKAAMGANSVVNTRFVIESADAIPLADFSLAAQEAVIFMYQAWGLCLFLLAMLGLVALIRYRSMTPLVFLLLGVENIARRAIYMADPYSFAAPSLTPSTGALINYALMAFLAAGFVLSLSNRKDAA